MDTISVIRKVLGQSVKGKPIEGIFLLGHGQQDVASQLPKVDTLFFGAFHGDEAISTELLNAAIQAWTEERFRGAPLDFAKNPVLLIPALNPDGLAIGTRTNGNGVDLNRNYPTPCWVSDNKDTPYYSGHQAASEPETQLVIQLLEESRPGKIVTVHSPYKVINFDGPARGLADAMAACSGYPVVEDIGYPTPGSFGNYCGNIRQIPVITLELPEDEPLETVWQDNAAALEAMVRFTSIPSL